MCIDCLCLGVNREYWHYSTVLEPYLELGRVRIIREVTLSIQIILLVTVLLPTTSCPCHELAVAAGPLATGKVTAHTKLIVMAKVASHMKLT